MKVYVVNSSGYWGRWVFSTKQKAINFLLKWIQEDYCLEDEELPAVEKELYQNDSFDNWYLYEVILDNENF